MRLFVKTHYLPILLFLLIGGGLIFSWFRHGLYYGGGDVGLPTYNPSRVFNITRYVWWEAVAPGFPVPQGVTSAPLEFFLSFLQLIGFSTLLIQVTLFFALLFLMGIGMYMFLKYSFNVSKTLACIGALFYIFNPYSMVQIWHRFVHTSIVFAAVLPFMIIFWQRWINTRKVSAVFLFILTNFLGVYLYGTIAYIITLWVFLFLLTFYQAFFPWKNFSTLWKFILVFIIGFLSWLLANLWWIIPSFSVGSSLFSEQHNNNESLSTLLEISKQTIIPYTLQLLNPFYIFQQAEFGDIYKNLFFVTIPWITVAFIFIGLIRSIKQKKLAIWGLIFLTIIFLAKGAASPFGYPYIIGFSRFFFLGALRNPFEKMGILLPFVTSILFINGILALEGKFKKNISSKSLKILLSIPLFLILIYAWPMFGGKIFGSLNKPAFIKVPETYNQIDKQLSSDHLEGNILHLPLTRIEGVSYNWKYGYNGVEPSQLLFSSNPSISRGFNIFRIDDTLTGLSMMFNEPSFNNSSQILSMLQAFDVRYIILHKDILWRGSDIYDFEKTEKLLNKLPYLQNKIQNKDLSLYEVLPQFYKTKIVLTNQVQYVSDQKSQIRALPWLSRNNEGEILTPLNTQDQDLILKNSNETMIFPEKSFEYLDASENGLDIIASNLATHLYRLSSTKNIITSNQDKENETLITQLISSGEDLINIYLAKKNNILPSNILLTQYIQTTSDLLDKDIRNSRLNSFVSISDIDEIFKLHLLILENLKITETNVIADRLRKDLSKRDLLPQFQYADKKDYSTVERQVLHYQVPQSGNYELLLSGSSIKDIYPEKLTTLNFQINDKPTQLNSISEGQFISFGNINLNQGEQEISSNTVLSNNLVPSIENLSKSTNVTQIDKDTLQLASNGQDVSYIEGDLGPVTGDDVYQVSFEGSFISGVEFYVQIIQDGDQIENNKFQPRISTFISRTSNNSEFQNYVFRTQPLNVATRKAKIRIIVDPIGTESFNTPLTPGIATTIQLKNVSIKRILNNEFFLKKILSTDNNGDTFYQNIEYQQKNPVFYTGKLKITKPTYLVFKESYNTSWRLTLESNNQIYHPSIHLLSNLYGNAWYIEKSGDYNFRIEFTPQEEVTWGGYFAILELIGMLLSVIILKIKNN